MFWLRSLPARPLSPPTTPAPSASRSWVGVGTVDAAKRFRQLVREAHFEGISVRNCYVCRRHGIGIFEDPIFCKALRKGCESNAAATCPQFSPFRSPEECAAAEARNLLYVETREKERLEQWEARTGFRKRPSSASTQAEQARDFISFAGSRSGSGHIPHPAVLRVHDQRWRVEVAKRAGGMDAAPDALRRTRGFPLRILSTEVNGPAG